ncbi:MAG: hypothetical protein E7052_07450 [Lentisphaerae bacterium]|nr:hypothetical protein [Lentisphaerota bacterium]
MKKQCFFRSILPALAALVLFCGCATPEIPADITLDELETRMSKAMDPAGSYRRASSYFQRQNIVEESFWGPKHQLVEVKFQRPDKHKLSYYRENKIVSEILGIGNQAWIINHTEGIITEITGDDLEKAKIMFALARPDTDFDKLFARVDLTMTTLDDDREYYKLHCQPALPDSNPIIIYVDKKESLPKRLIVTVKTPDGPKRTESIIEKYQQFDQVMLPVLTKVVEDDREYITRTVGYLLNAHFSQQEFQIPQFDPVLMEMKRQQKRRR